MHRRIRWQCSPSRLDPYTIALVRTPTETIMDSTTINLQAHLDSACRSFLRALDTGEEADLYEGLDRVLGYPCDLANSAAPTERAYYFCPQGAVSATWKMSKRDLAIAADPTYRDSDDKRGQSSNVAASQEPAADAAARRFMASDPDSLKSSQAPVRRCTVTVPVRLRISS